MKLSYIKPNLKTGLFVSIALGLLQTANADEIYKITRDDGSVYYSNVAPGEAEEAKVLDAIPEPSEEDRLAAEQRLREIRESAEERRTRRAELSGEPDVENDIDDIQFSAPPANPLPAITPFL